jgi:hypothetical protein
MRWKYNELLLSNSFEGSGRGLFEGTNPNIALREEGKGRKTLVRIKSSPAEIRTRSRMEVFGVPNTPKCSLLLVLEAKSSLK